MVHRTRRFYPLHVNRLLLFIFHFSDFLTCDFGICCDVDGHIYRFHDKDRFFDHRLSIFTGFDFSLALDSICRGDHGGLLLQSLSAGSVSPIEVICLYRDFLPVEASVVHVVLSARLLRHTWTLAEFEANFWLCCLEWASLELVVSDSRRHGSVLRGRKHEPLLHLWVRTSNLWQSMGIKAVAFFVN